MIFISKNNKYLSNYLHIFLSACFSTSLIYQRNKISQPYYIKKGIVC